MKKLLLLFAAVATFSMCSKDSDDHTFNIFTVQDDIALGKQTDSTIMANPSEYPVLSKSQYPAPYAYIEKIRDKILASGKLNHKNDFEWSVKIIKDDNTLNAFCTPGGYIYVYTGLMKYLDTEDQLAGVLGHEMAHADRRHSTDQLTQQYGISVLLEILLGKNQGTLTQIAASLVSLKFSRTQEAEADEYSVVYLCPTDYNAAGAAGFFQKLEEAGQGGQTPEFLSSHPNDASRIQNINTKKQTLGCTGSGTYSSEYSAFKSSLP